MRLRSIRRMGKRSPAAAKRTLDGTGRGAAPPAREAAGPVPDARGSERSTKAGKFRDDHEKQVEEELAEEEQAAEARSGLAALFGGWRLFPRAFRYVRPYRFQVGSTLLFTLFLALLALAQPWPLAFVIDTILGDKAAPKWITGYFGDSTGQLIFVAVLATLLISLLTGAFTVLNGYIQTKLSGRMSLDFRSDILQHIQRLSFTWHDNMRTGILMYRMTGGVSAIDLIVRLPTFGQSVITMIGMGWIAYRINSTLAWLAMIVLPLIYFSLIYYANRIEPAVKRVRAMEGMSLAIAHEVASMVRVIVSFGRERHEYDRFRSQAGRAVDARVNLTLRQTLFNLVVNLITAGGTAAVLGVGAYQVLNGRMSAGELLVIMAYIAQVYGPLENLATFLTTSQQTFILFEYALRLLDERPDVVEKPDAVTLDRVTGRISFEDVGFSYEEREDVLEGISFGVEAGQAIAIVGPTGAGKSTLLSLLPRFYDPSAGRITIDGVDLRDVRIESLRSQFSIVLQEPLLFTGTIKDNIRYGNPDATDAEVVEAAKAANAHDFIRKLPDRYRTTIGERGAKISGGERQRIAIARAFLRDAPVLILDEPTSSIDSKTEEGILEALERLMAGRTTIVVAHRLSTIRGVDRILVMDTGKIVQEGSHDQLVERRGLYRQLWGRQARRGQRGRGSKVVGPMMLELESAPAGKETTDTRGAKHASRPRNRAERRPARVPIRWRLPADSDSTGGAPKPASEPRRPRRPASDALAMLRGTDHIVVLDNGSAAQVGSHDELLARAGPYRQTWETHLRRSIEARGGEANGPTKPITGAGATPPSKFAAALARRPPTGASGNGSDRRRLAEIRARDRVLVMKAGEFVQSGTHDELLARDGPYRELWQRRAADDKGPPVERRPNLGWRIVRGSPVDIVAWAEDER